VRSWEREVWMEGKWGACILDVKLGSWLVMSRGDRNGFE